MFGYRSQPKEEHYTSVHRFVAVSRCNHVVSLEVNAICSPWGLTENVVQLKHYISWMYSNILQCTLTDPEENKLGLKRLRFHSRMKTLHSAVICSSGLFFFFSLFFFY